MSAKYLFWLPLLFLLSCQPESINADIPPIQTPEIWYVDHTPSLRWLSPFYNECIRQNPEIGLIVNEIPATQIDTVEADFILRWGPPSELHQYSAVVGADNFVFIIHPENQIEAITTADVSNIYSNNIHYWEQFQENSTISQSKIQIWTYPKGSDVQEIFETLFNISLAHPSSHIAPDPQAMVQAIAANPSAIGYIPESWLNSTVSQLGLNDMPKEALFQPILSISDDEPQGVKRQWLVCIQEKIN